jgi:hypothetical protein
MAPYKKNNKDPIKYLLNFDIILLF